MADTQTAELGSLEIPKTEPYRVIAVGASYRAPVETIGPDGKPTIIYVSQLGARGEQIDLVEYEGRRLSALGAVRPAGEARGYDELADDELRSLASQRGVVVRSSGADADQPLREDFINALLVADRTLGDVRGAATQPGGVVAPNSATGETVLTLDGRTPPLSTEQADSVVTAGVVEANQAPVLAEQREAAASGGSTAPAYDASGKSPTELAAWISDESPKASEVVAAAGSDPATARALIEAEQAAQGGDGRKTVVEPLEKIAAEG